MYFYGRTFASSHPARWGITRDVFGGRTPRHWPRAMQDDLHNMLSVQNPNGKHLFQKYWAATKLCRMNHFDTPYLISIYSWCSFLRLVDVSILSNPENKVGTGTGHVPWSQFCILALACSPACGTISVNVNLDICIVKCTITRMGSHMPCIRIFGQNTSGHWNVLLLDKMSQSIGRLTETERQRGSHWVLIDLARQSSLSNLKLEVFRCQKWLLLHLNSYPKIWRLQLHIDLEKNHTPVPAVVERHI